MTELVYRMDISCWDNTWERPLHDQHSDSPKNLINFNLTYVYISGVTRRHHNDMVPFAVNTEKL